MKVLRSLFASICAVALTTASVYAQKNDLNWAVYNPPNPKVVYTCRSYAVGRVFLSVPL